MKKLLLLGALCGALFANSLEEIQEKKVIRIGVTNHQPPFSSVVNGERVGFESDMGKEIAKRLLGDEGKIEWTGITNSKDRITYLQENKLDLILANFTVTEDRKKQVDFCEPYFTVALGLVSRVDNRISTPADMEGKKIAVQANSTAETYVKDKGADIIHITKSRDAFEMVRNGEADGFINDNLIVMAYPIEDGRVIVPETMRNLGATSYLAPAVQKGNYKLRDKINEIMMELSKEQFFVGIYNNTLDVFYKGQAKPDMFLLESIYQILGDVENSFKIASRK